LQEIVLVLPQVILQEEEEEEAQAPLVTNAGNRVILQEIAMTVQKTRPQEVEAEVQMSATIVDQEVILRGIANLMQILIAFVVEVPVILQGTVHKKESLIMETVTSVVNRVI